jgi:hypothetical protein
MRALFSLVGLLVVVAIVMLLGKKQLQAVAPVATPPTSAATTSVPEQSRGVQQKVQQDVSRALEQGAARSGDSQP